MDIVITSYEKPDLDGVSTMYAYAEYLNKIGINSSYYVWGIPKKEVAIVCNMFNISIEGVTSIEENQEVVLVDTNNLEEVPYLKAEQIVEIIDHHSKNKSSDKCINAIMQIERVGAAATLVAERFKQNNITISRDSAILLYYGIISNSINLKANVTAQKDIEMTNWLKEQCDEISEEKIEEIFTLKSKIEDKDLRVEMEAEIALNYKNEKITIAQLEVANMEDFLKEKEDKIVKILSQIKQEKNLDYIVINCVDILNGFNIILTVSDKEEQLFNKIFGYEFKNRRCKINKIMQRKDLTKAIREASINDKG